MRVFVPGVRKFNDDSDSRRCRHDFQVQYLSLIVVREGGSESVPSRASRYQMSLLDASDQDYTLELQKFIEDLSQIPERTPVVSELEGMLNSKVQKF